MKVVRSIETKRRTVPSRRTQPNRTLDVQSSAFLFSRDELDEFRSFRLRCSADGQLEYFNGLGSDLGNYEQGKITVSKINPWTLQLCKKQTEKFHRQYLGDENGSVSQSAFCSPSAPAFSSSLRSFADFLLMENVTARFRYPCILDLKMGKRQYAEIDSDKKRQSKIEKCQLSTSSTLGVRLCGMQVYQVDHGRYIFTDKYRGRLLTVDGFRSALVEFIDNGRSKRFDILPAIIERLQSLHQTIAGLANYRFYSGSLLVVYDGLPSSDLIELRMIDFAHSILLPSATTDESSGEFDPDRDYLFGLERLIDVFREILANQNDPMDSH